MQTTRMAIPSQNADIRIALSPQPTTRSTGRLALLEVRFSITMRLLKETGLGERERVLSCLHDHPCAEWLPRTGSAGAVE
jgi:hypothetical protein